MGKKKHIRKKGADIGLVQEQFWQLDKEFYDNYPREYFLTRLEDILIRISQSEKVSAALNGTEIRIGKLTTRYQRDDNKQIESYAKIELFETYIHCMESFFRLFYARASLSDCDWLAIARLSISDYHNALSKVLHGDFSGINSSLSADGTIQYALTGFADKDIDIGTAELQNWKEWIIHCAYELSEVKAYNSYKHGLTIRASTGGLMIKPEGEDIELGRHGNIIRYLTTSEKSDRFVWIKKTEFIDLDVIGYKVFVYGQLICSMINTGRHQHGYEEKTERWYPGKELTPNLGKNEIGEDLEAFFQTMDSYACELLYYSEKATGTQTSDQ